MKFETLSVVVGTKKCNANCRYCVSRLTQGDVEHAGGCNLPRLDIAMKLARDCQEVIVTGVGEPTLEISTLKTVIGRLWEAGFPIITLQTNGIAVSDEYACDLKAVGLSRIALSTCGLDIDANRDIMRSKHIPDPLLFTARMKKLGLSTRLSVIATIAAFDDCYSTGTPLVIIHDCIRDGSVDQLTFRDLGGKSEWINENFFGLRPLRHYLSESPDAVELLRIPHGCTVYDYHGQNVAVTNCLTESTRLEKQRQLICFPSGRLAYSWQHKGAVIL